MKGICKLLAVDPSLTCSGWALFSLENRALLGVGKIRSKPPSEPLQARLLDLQQQVNRFLLKVNAGVGDILVCEGPTTMKDPRAAIKVEQVRGIFESMSRAQGIQVPGRLNPRSVQVELMGMKGRQTKRETVKKTALGVVKNLYGTQLDQIGFSKSEDDLRKNQDIVDAILVGHLALGRISTAIQGSIALEEIFSESGTRRRSSRFAWGSGESNTFGWSSKEISYLGRKG
ncbi:MAG: hypothetical protein KDD53_00555 [Bdellovibrionales bacterium]|nr:hypothetical protein [Bdellovibrionales bacterium]